MNAAEFDRVVRNGCAPERQKFYLKLTGKGLALASLEPKLAAKLLPVYRKHLIARGVPDADAEQLAYACLWRTPRKVIAAARR
jgi:hypothetical protein